MSVTIYRRSGSVLFTSQTAITQAEAINEIVTDAQKRGETPNLDGASLARASLDRANLVGAYLVGANLVGASLVGANLDGASLVGANLDGASLVGASLARASLARASLARAYLDRANLVGAIGAPELLQLGPVDTWLITLINTPKGWRVCAGCRDFTVAEAREHWMAKRRHDWANYTPGHGARMIAAVEALISLATAYGWPEITPEPVEAVPA